MVDRAGLNVAEILAKFIEKDVLPPLEIAPEKFWKGAAEIFAAFSEENAKLLEERDRLQTALNDWHFEHAGVPVDQKAYQAFLRSVGYLVAEPPSFEVSPANVDEEISRQAGPQLVVPVLNARFALNAANARWGSLYDALYGSDVIPGKTASGYDPARGDLVVKWAKTFLDDVLPLKKGSWSELTGAPVLRDPKQYVGQRGDNLLYRNNGLHIEIIVDREHPIGRGDPAGISDVILESAITTIIDLEDSVAVVDAEDKVAAYANWLGLMRGDLKESFLKSGRPTTRRLSEDRQYVSVTGELFSLPGRSLLFVRNVGHLMTTPAVRLPDGREAPEGILDAIVTSLIGLFDLRGIGGLRNSKTGSIYIVKPKMHGPAEAAFSDRLFNAVEDLLGLQRHTIKIGVMDEERRTSANLAACIHAVRNRIVFINTGFLDRTGDEIHSSMLAGPMVPKGEIRSSTWLAAYEDRNVQIGLRCGLSGKAQIGKGMWAAPDLMGAMLKQKVGHLEAGATTAWVPSPTAATLHATHYHKLDVFARHEGRRKEQIAPLSDLLTPPLAYARKWTEEEIRDDVDNNCQGILGYVVRWIDQGIGCSKVPDIHDVGLMEDRATLRISSQALANWLLHGLCTPKDVDEAFSRMAHKVDEQNAHDPLYKSLANNPSHPALKAARALVFEGQTQPNGYTEPTLHRYRREVKSSG